MTSDSQPNYPVKPWRINPWVVLLLLVGACAVMPWDVPISAFFVSGSLPGEVRSLIHKTEFFGHAYGILGIVITIYLLSEDRRRQLPRLVCAALFAGIASDVVKLLVHRTRPVDFSFVPGESTFLGWSFMHAESVGDVFNSAYHSFPSAHTATSVAFALALGAMYPRAAKWFLTLGILVGVSRFDGGAHYVSDTLIGGLLGYICANLVLGNTAVSRWFNAFESGRRFSATDRMFSGESEKGGARPHPAH